MSEKKYFVQNETEYGYIANKLNNCRWQGTGNPIREMPNFNFPVMLFVEDETASFWERAGSDYDFIRVSDLIKQNKDIVYMTSDEKAEFDELKNDSETLSRAFSHILSEVGYEHLLSKMFSDGYPSKEDNQAQFEFARAWADPSLIVVKDEPKYAYKLKDYVKPLVSNDDADFIYLGLHGDLSELQLCPEYQTMKEWKKVPSKVRKLFMRIPEK